ncbi:MAG TPA: ABC transporter permease subunit, partial [Egibacteraceae bacterium]|nr:ABC transporter permease subunit [Egibacteraceae bacterium]
GMDVSARMPLLWLALYRRRRMLATLAGGLALFELLIVLITRAVPAAAMLASAPDVADAFDAFSGSSGGVPLASLPGLLGAGLNHPLWVALHLTAVCSLAAAAVASDVEAGTVELVMSRPVSRRRLLGERCLALTAATAGLHVAAAAGLIAGLGLAPAARAEVGLAGVAAASVSGLGLTVAVAGLTLAVSAVARRKSHVIGAGVAVAVVGYALNFFARAWEPARFLRWASPFHYYRPADALVAGTVSWADLAVLLGVGAAGYLAAAALLARRDLAP